MCGHRTTSDLTHHVDLPRDFGATQHGSVAMGGGDSRRFYFDASPSSSFKASSIARMVA